MNTAAGLVEFVHFQSDGGKAEILELECEAGTGLTEDLLAEDDTITDKTFSFLARERGEARKVRL